MDAIELLKKDHAKVTELFHRFNDGGGLTGVVKRLTGSVSPREHRAAAERICAELDVHARIEEEIFYPAVRALGDARLDELLGESLDEHSTIKERVAAVRAALADDEALKARGSALQECVDHHVREEEKEMFPLLEARMPEAERMRLGRELTAAKRSAAPPARKAPKRAAPTRKAASRARKTTAKARKRPRTKKASGDRRR